MFWVIAGIFITAFLLVILFTICTADGDATLMAAERSGKTIEVLEGKVVWITGASCGIGEQLAYWLAIAGCKLVLSSRTKTSLEKVKAKCIDKSNNKLKEADILVLPFDLTVVDDHDRSVEKVLNHFNQIDILINNAGRGQRGQARNTDIHVDRAMLEINTIAPISLTKSVLPHMIKRKQGHICVTSSVNGIIAAANETIYDASKFALHGFFKALRMEVHQYNIDVSILAPGPVFSELQKEAFTETLQQKYNKPFEKTDKRMATERCAFLMGVAIANRIDETWIADQPTLLLTYIGQYMPTIYTWISRKFGKTMNKMLQSSGKKNN